MRTVCLRKDVQRSNCSDSCLRYSENSICQKQDFMFKTFINFEPVERFEKRRLVTGFRGFNNSMSKRILNMLKMIYLRIWKWVTVVEFRLNNGGGKHWNWWSSHCICPCFDFNTHYCCHLHSLHERTERLVCIMKAMDREHGQGSKEVRIDIVTFSLRSARIDNWIKLVFQNVSHRTSGYFS